MTSFATLNLGPVEPDRLISDRIHQSLLSGEILLQTENHTAWGGAVTAQMYLPIQRSQAWCQLTDYTRWVHYFPDMVQSRLVSAPDSGSWKRLYQVARKSFFMFSAQVEIYLRVFEKINSTVEHQIQFHFERGDFKDFTAFLTLRDFSRGTLLTYQVQATPMIPVPGVFIQEAMKLDLPANMKNMRQVLCASRG